MRDLSNRNTVETIELVGGAMDGKIVTIPNDEREEHLVPFFRDDFLPLTHDEPEKPISLKCYVYKRRIPIISYFDFIEIRPFPG